MMGNYTIPVSPYVANNGGGGFGSGNGDALWIFALLVLFGGGGFGGGFGGRNSAIPEATGYQLGELAGKVATKDSISVLQNSTNMGFAGINTAIQTSTTQISNGLANTTFEIANRISALANQISECCCAIQRQISEGFGQMRYDMANFAAQTNANIADWGNKILMDNSRRAEAASAQRINQLELNAALCGVVRYPLSQTFNAGPYPPNGCGC